VGQYRSVHQRTIAAGTRRTVQPMKVFVSHKQQDAPIAAAVARRLRANDVAFYLDTFDHAASAQGDDIGEYLREALGKCTHLLAVVSEQTRLSWWVPWEIGVATEKDFPISTYAGGRCDLPGYLKKWPYLSNLPDVDVWVEASRKAVRRSRAAMRLDESAAVRRARSTRHFYRSVRAALGQ
jgi:hypothetical protein